MATWSEKSRLTGNQDDEGSSQNTSSQNAAAQCLFKCLCRTKGLNDQTIVELINNGYNSTPNLLKINDDDLSELKIKKGQRGLLKKWLMELHIGYEEPLKIQDTENESSSLCSSNGNDAFDSGNETDNNTASFVGSVNNTDRRTLNNRIPEQIGVTINDESVNNWFDDHFGSSSILYRDNELEGSRVFGSQNTSISTSNLTVTADKNLESEFLASQKKHHIQRLKNKLQKKKGLSASRKGYSRTIPNNGTLASTRLDDSVKSAQRLPDPIGESTRHRWCWIWCCGCGFFVGLLIDKFITLRRRQRQRLNAERHHDARVTYTNTSERQSLLASELV